MKVKLIGVLAITSFVSACTGLNQSHSRSGEVYSSSEVQHVMFSDSCTVLSARSITVVADGHRDVRRNNISEVAGATTGALIGRAIGNEIGNGEGRKLARNLGTIGGAVVGSNISRNANEARNMRQGIEYQVATASGHVRAVIQNLNAGEGVIPAGSGCRIVSGGGVARITPR